MTSFRFAFVLVFLSCAAWAAQSSGSWQPIGPFGGDARSLTADPGDFRRLYLGTSNSQIYFSSDGGAHWAHWSEIAARPDLVIGHILVHPGSGTTLYASAYTVSDGDGGGVFLSTDGGKSWKDLPDIHGQSVRALAMAPSDPRTLVAGSLEGIFRSTDAGDHWTRISPEHHAEIRNVESISIDPADVRVIYAGTWHLPWKTSDGGKAWYSVKAGILDDSDVFAITIDWSNRDTAYLGACSGIYRTENGGILWRKVQGMPFAARRTRAIRQDPRQSRVVYAGTTEGLWKTDNGGTSWALTSVPGLIVNDVAIDPRDSQHLLLATDRAGILESRDGARTFQEANAGFSHRQAWRVQASTSGLLASVRHDKEYGGLFMSAGVGRDWRRLPDAGLGGNDILSLALLPNGDLLAGVTGGGLYRYSSGGAAWQSTGKLLRPVKLASGRNGFSGLPFTMEVDELAAVGGVLYAAGADGVLRSNDGGVTWLLMSPHWNATHVAASAEVLAAATDVGLRVSRDSGITWAPAAFADATAGTAATYGLAVAGQTIYAATGLGLYKSSDAGVKWERYGRGVPIGPVYDVAVDPENPTRVFAGSAVTQRVYASANGGESYDELPQPGFAGSRPRRLAVGANGGLFMASGYDGLFYRQP